MTEAQIFEAELERIKQKLTKDDWMIIESYITQWTSVPGVIIAKDISGFTDVDAVVKKVKARNRQQATHCKHGHPLTDGHPNVHINKKGARVCRMCKRAYRRQQTAKQGKEAVNAYNRAWRRKRITPKTAFERAAELAARSRR
jgi:hypothetical protein